MRKLRHLIWLYRCMMRRYWSAVLWHDYPGVLSRDVCRKAVRRGR